MDAETYKEHLLSEMRQVDEAENTPPTQLDPKETLKELVMSRTQRLGLTSLDASQNGAKLLRENIRKSDDVFTTKFYHGTFDKLATTTGAQFTDKTLKTEDYNLDIANKPNNFQKTQISEYSNAIHNNRVFINPRYLSC